MKNFSTGAPGKGKRPFTLADQFDVVGVSGVKLSPDGTHLLCVTTRIDVDRNSRRDFIVLINLDNRDQKVLAEGSAPCWSPDGFEIAYQSEDGGLWIYHLARDEKRQLGRIYESSFFLGYRVDKNFFWSPDGKHIAYVSALPALAEEGNKKEVRVIDRLLYKSKGGRGRSFFADDDLTHVWVIPASGGEAQLVTAGEYNEHSISWSADSREIVFISNRSGDPDNNQLYDLWRLDIKTKQVSRLTENFGTIVQTACSPDGGDIAFVATTQKVTSSDSPSEDTHLFILSGSDAAPRCLTRSVDRKIENISWHPGGEFVYFMAGSEGRTLLYRVSIVTETVEVVIDGNFHILEYSLSAGTGDIAFARTDITHPSEAFLFQPHENRVLQITDFNKVVLDRCLIADAETVWFESFDGTSVQGWLMRPVSFDPARAYPLILVMHGGPHNMFGYEFEERMQLLCSAGYAVLFVNPRGSTGYGQIFSSGCVLNWGGGDYEDLMAGVDHVIEKYPWIDPERLGVTGQSYGGYMTNWIITQTNRFKAAVSDGGLSNLISFAGTSLYHSLMESEFNGSAYDNFPLLWQWSPLRMVGNVTTPTLFLHGAIDNEVPVSQAEEMYVALKKAGVTTSLVLYMNEGHGWRPDLTPENRCDLNRRIVSWFDRFV